MAALLAKPDCSEEEVAAYLEEFTRCYADYGEQRRKEVGMGGVCWLVVGGVWWDAVCTTSMGRSIAYRSVI